MQPFKLGRTNEFLWLITLYQLITSNKLTCNSQSWYRGVILLMSTPRSSIAWLWDHDFHRMKMWEFLHISKDSILIFFSSLATNKLYTMAKAIQVAYQIEEEAKRKALVSNIRSERIIVDANWENSIGKSQGNCITLPLFQYLLIPRK